MAERKYLKDLDRCMIGNKSNETFSQLFKQINQNIDNLETEIC